MPVQPTYPGLYIEELPNTSRVITAAPTSITVFVGYVHPFQGECADPTTPRWGEPIRIFNFADYERYFGGLYINAVIGRSEVGYAVNQFFLNGGADAYVVGLQPRYYEEATPANSEPVKGSVNTTAFTGLEVTAKELTDAAHRVRVTIRNVRDDVVGGATIANGIADILVTYGQVVEAYRDVRIGDLAARLAGSRLISIRPWGGGAMPTAYTGVSQPLELQTMPDPTTFTGDLTTYYAKAFTDVFTADAPLDKIEIFNLLAVPGIADAAVWNAALHFCADKRAFFLMDPPERASADGVGGLLTIQSFVDSGVIPTSVPNGALYFPYLKTVDAVSGDVIELPPSGYVAGVFARTDTNRGVWKAPAGLETSLANTTGVVESGRMTDMRQGTVNDLGVNVLRSFPGSGTVVWGARTLVTKNPSFQQWKYVPVRRMALFIEQSLLRNLGWVVFEPNDEPLWAAIRLTIEGFMLSLFRQQAFQGGRPSDAFLVKCDKTTTTQTDIDNGIVNIVVGFRPLKPAEFVIIKIAQLAGQVQA